MNCMENGKKNLVYIQEVILNEPIECIQLYSNIIFIDSNLNFCTLW